MQTGPFYVAASIDGIAIIADRRRRFATSHPADTTHPILSETGIR